MNLTRHLPPMVAKQLARTRRSEQRLRLEPTETNVRYHVAELLVLERMLSEWADGMEEGSDE
ncbi:hypothetical protein AAK967_02310 [Atopobiaceae bacterium 24-176]